jgi:hypothetical protein
MYPTVTLLGAHSLGHTHIEVSGYGFHPPPGTDADLVNAWDNTPAALDNDYYVKLLTMVRDFALFCFWSCSRFTSDMSFV